MLGFLDGMSRRCQWPEKHRHATEGAAWAAIKSMKSAGDFTEDLRPYPCGSHWHVGHSKEALGKRISRSLRKDKQ